MVKHIILWKLNESLSDAEKLSVKENAKRELEGLLGKIDGLLAMNIEIRRLPSSNADMMLYSEFSDEASLKGYASHPLHCEVADRFVRPFTVQRLCLDFEV